MRAFLSHSSKDKGFIDEVASILRPGTYELDSETFDAGLVNAEAIRIALARSDLFCLFLSRSSILSHYVEFETLLGLEFLARGGIFRFLTICLDDGSFNQATENLKYFNIVRKSLSPDSVARLIQGQLISVSAKAKNFSHPFLGRDEEIRSVERQLSDHKRPNIKCFYFSGNAGTGRRSLASKIYANFFPQVGRVHPTISLHEFDGPLEIYRNLLIELKQGLGATELRSHMTGFNAGSTTSQLQTLSSLINSVLQVNESIVFVDEGGLTTDSGSIAPEISKVISRLESRPFPPVTFISPRMVPSQFRDLHPDIIFQAVKTLEWDIARDLLSSLLKRQNVITGTEDLDELTRLAEGHPINIYRISEEVGEKGVTVFLASAGDFNEWKHKQTSEYLSKIKLTRNDIITLCLLRSMPELDFDTIVSATNLDSESLARDIYSLVLKHVLDAERESFRIAPALRVAVERDIRVQMPEAVQLEATKYIARSLVLRLEEGTAPASLVDAAALASIEVDEYPNSFATAFLLPSHYVRLSKIRYEKRQWSESIRFGMLALDRESRLSVNGLVAACRFVCLASARVGDDEVFERSLKKLEGRAVDNWSRSNLLYLRGFQLRMKGRLPAAQDLFQAALDQSRNNTSAIRELAAIALARGDLGKAEGLAREAHNAARTNVYFADILLTVLIRGAATALRSSEIEDLFSILEKHDQDSGRSFYTTRRAEFEHLWGDNKEAINLIEAAATKTPTIFEILRLKAKIYLKDKNNRRAEEAIEAMASLMNNRVVFDRRSNFRAYLEAKSHYLVETGKFGEAKDLLRDPAYFTIEERDAAIKDIEITEGYSRQNRQ